MTKDVFKLAVIGLMLFGAGFILKSFGVAESSAEASANETNHLTFVTDDGLTLHAWISGAVLDPEGATGKAGLALLLPMLSKTHASYERSATRLNEIGYTTIAFDMRGHGESVRLNKKMLSYADMDEDQFGKMPEDIAQFFHDFRKNHPGAYDYDDVVVIGASIGANTAAMMIAEPWVSRAILLSPGRDYRGIRPEVVLAAENDPPMKSLYIAASVEDTYSAESSQWFFDNYEGPKKLMKYPGSEHGTDILLNVPEADSDLLDWLREK
jgi:alpha-beta hydrolase superfamily lysophospholipase